MRKRHFHGKRLIYLCIDCIEEGLGNGKDLTSLVKHCSEKYDVHRTNVYRWWRFYDEWGEIKAVIRERRMRLRRRYKTHRLVTRRHIQELKNIVDQHPEYFLDEYAEELLRRTHTSFSLPTISRILRQDLNLTLQVCFEVARQRNEHERALYLHALDSIVSVFEDPRMLIFIDETHKD